MRDTTQRKERIIRVRMTEGLYNALRDVSKGSGRPVSETVRRGIERAVETNIFTSVR